MVLLMNIFNTLNQKKIIFVFKQKIKSIFEQEGENVFSCLYNLFINKTSPLYLNIQKTNYISLLLHINLCSV